MANPQLALPEGFGTASYVPGERSFKFFKMEEGQNIYRILPPMKSMRNNKKGWAIYYGLHYGWNGQDPTDPAKTKFRPFLCIQERDFKTQMVTCTCAACTLRDARQAQYTELDERCKKERTPEAERKQLIAPLADWLRLHSVDRGWRMLVMNQQNEFGVLRISNKTKKKLDALVQRLSQQGYDPCGVNGVWIEFNRSGKGFETDVTPEAHRVLQTIQDGTTGRTIRTEVIMDSELTYDLATRALEVCPDLKEMMEGARLSDEQITKLVNGSGDPAEVDEIWGWSQKSKEEVPVTPPAPRPAPAPTPPPAPAPKPAPAPAPVAEAEVEDEEAAMMRKLAELRAKKAAAVNATPAPAPAPKPAPAQTGVSAEDLLSMGEEDFEAQFKSRG